MTRFNKNPTILQVLPALESGGVERGTVEIARGLSKAGWHSLVASAGGKMQPLLTSCGATHFTLPLDSKHPWRIWRNAHALQKIIRKHRVDIIHARSRAPAWSAYLAAKATGCKFITTFHGVYNAQNDWKQRYNSIMTRGERVIAVSYFIADHMVQNYGLDAGRIRVIPRGVDLNVFHPSRMHPQRMVELSRQWSIPEALPVIFFPGRVTRWKGQDIFLKALASLPHRNFFAIIAGNDKAHPDYREELERLVKDGGLEGYARIVGDTSYMAEAYTLSRFVVSASVEPEAFGRVALEAQAMARPVIAGNHGGACETVIDNVTGWLVEPGNVDALRNRIEHALAMDSEAYYTMGIQGMENAYAFSSTHMIENTLGVYEEVLGISRENERENF